ncbi:MAG: sugar transferase [Bryobacterales bacterium]|nr:sugar transferase [Bryobacterales bacterium]
MIDILGSLLALSLFAPVMILLALAVRMTSRGPILFRQQRLGLAGIPFSILKFRTMRHNAEDIRNSDGSSYSASDDPRVTAIGRLMRKSSMDELPQFWNVLRGEMSLVGPRPDQVDQLTYYTPEDRIKLRMRPGITGLAQISGRNSISWARRRQFDAEYVTNWSLGEDLRILLMTIPYVLLRRDIHTGRDNADRNSTAAA